VKAPRRRDGGVSLGKKNYYSKNPPSPPFFKGDHEETPQQKLWGIINLIKLEKVK
jgi:hypothetical protein